MGGKATQVVKKPESIAGIAAAPFTGGASLALVGDAAYREKEKEEYIKRGEEKAKKQAVLEAKRESDATEERRKRKMSDLAGREESEATGLSSLIGKGKTLG